MKHFSQDADLARLLTPTDGFVFALVLFVTCLLPVFFIRSKKSNSTGRQNLEYFLMGRKLTLPFFVATLVATWYGGVFGVTRIAFEQGIFNFVIQGLFWYFAYFFFALVMIDRIFKFPTATSMPDLVQKLYGPRAAKICAVFNYFDVVPVVYVISLGFFFQTILGGDATYWMLGTASFLACYTAIGGFRGIVITDIFQFVAMLIAILSIPMFSFFYVGSPILLFHSLPSSHLNPTGGESLWQLLVWGLIAFSTLIDPNFYQRCLACPNPQLAKKGLLFSIGFWFIIDCATTLSGLYAKMVMPDAAPQNAYLLYSLQLLPDGVKGLFCAGIVATIVSTLDSYLFTGGQTLMSDLFGKTSIRWHRLGVLVTALLACQIACYFEGNIKEVWRFFGSLSAACLLVPVVISMSLKWKISEEGFILSCTLSTFCLCLWKFLVAKTSFFYVEPFYIGSLCSFIICFLSQRGKSSERRSYAG